jgi:hypothetical protein
MCCNGCICMLQVLVPNVSSAFCKRMLQVGLSGCCICFTHTLQAFLSRCCVCLQWFSSVFRCFLQVFQKHVSSVSFVFKYMLQALHLDVSKVDQILYTRCTWEPGGGASVRRGRCWGGAGPAWVHRHGVGGGMLARARSAGACAQETNCMGYGTVYGLYLTDVRALVVSLLKKIKL